MDYVNACDTQRRRHDGLRADACAPARCSGHESVNRGYIRCHAMTRCTHMCTQQTHCLAFSLQLSEERARLLPRDDPLVHLVGAIREAQRARVEPHGWEHGVLAHTHAAVSLDGAVRNVEGHGGHRHLSVRGVCRV